ncbi:uncharacterized protein DUF559 [Barrientosiimonas humi]|uniref:Uncharacterized protein DUF559 n=1 Tax=Barrientosiimonas humi TaxID=999931 RepID=A0A542XCM9_9MICO|nr:DUF559 domain-containing protein [Barrientosiimonas humi]TQL33569.1 uncharacterized protein DUF559 [Barrientosiimonas humi]CAG7573557.1 hypothetical protein BH39T_PBIAJDOK_02193 [Barrientosiimonas humi]
MSRAVIDALRERGGAARLGDLLGPVTRREIAESVGSADICRLAHGVYCLPELEPQLRRAVELSGTLSHVSAAVRHGWSVKAEPRQAWVTIPPNRHLRVPPPRDVRLVWRPVPPEDVVDGVTEPLRTTLDCARDLPFDEALAVADSALRSGMVTARELRWAADRLRGPRSAAARRVATHGTGESAGPMESVLRAICLDVPGLAVTPQLIISDDGFWARVDLGDEDLRIVIEAEGFEHHGTRQGFDKDTERYTELVSRGWLVLRFTWTQIMFHPEWVRERIVETVRLRRAAA